MSHTSCKKQRRSLEGREGERGGRVVKSERLISYLATLALETERLPQSQGRACNVSCSANRYFSNKVSHLRWLFILRDYEGRFRPDVNYIVSTSTRSWVVPPDNTVRDILPSLLHFSYTKDTPEICIPLFSSSPLCRNNVLACYRDLSFTDFLSTLYIVYTYIYARLSTFVGADTSEEEMFLQEISRYKII